MMVNQFFRKLFAFLKRDFLINSSYRLSFFLDFISILASVTTFFFISKLFGEGAAKHLEEFGGDYFSFVLIGLAFSGYLSSALSSFSQTISYEQSEGTLEILLLSPTNISTILLCSTIWNFIFVSLKVVVYLFLGWLIFGFDISKINTLSVVIILILTIASFSSLGILSSSFLLVFKRGDPINWALGGISRLLGGVYFPIKVLPVYLQKISFLLPITYALSAMRKSIIGGESLKGLTSEITYLLIFSLIVFPLSIISFKLALRKAKKHGSLLYS
jgi:ABC-2 type transport system permease protein